MARHASPGVADLQMNVRVSLPKTNGDFPSRLVFYRVEGVLNQVASDCRQLSPVSGLNGVLASRRHREGDPAFRGNTRFADQQRHQLRVANAGR